MVVHAFCRVFNASYLRMQPGVEPSEPFGWLEQRCEIVSLKFHLVCKACQASKFPPL